MDYHTYQGMELPKEPEVSSPEPRTKPDQLHETHITSVKPPIMREAVTATSPMPGETTKKQKEQEEPRRTYPTQE